MSMFSKTIFSLAAALLLFGGVASAAPNDAEFSAAEAGSPDSIEYPHRVLDRRAPSNEEIDALESGNPDSVLYRNRMIEGAGITAADWLTLEYGNPDAR
jgi:hypothetical protein